MKTTSYYRATHTFQLPEGVYITSPLLGGAGTGYNTITSESNDSVKAAQEALIVAVMKLCLDVQE